MDWIDARTELPEKGTTVLSYIQWSEDVDYVVVHYDKNGNWYGKLGPFITHWMPLPQPPKTK